MGNKKKNRNKNKNYQHKKTNANVKAQAAKVNEIKAAEKKDDTAKAGAEPQEAAVPYETVQVDAPSEEAVQADTTQSDNAANETVQTETFEHDIQPEEVIAEDTIWEETDQGEAAWSDTAAYDETVYFEMPDDRSTSAEEISETEGAETEVFTPEGLETEAAETEILAAESHEPEASKAERSNAEIPKAKAAKPQHPGTTKSASGKGNTAKSTQHRQAARRKEEASFSSKRIQSVLISVFKILLPAAACVIVVAVIITFVNSRKSRQADTAANLAEQEQWIMLENEPLEVDAHENVNELMRTFYTALADGDMDTVQTLRDQNTETELITYEEKSKFIESYDDVTCYTKSGMEENSYFVYVTYEVKLEDVETKAPGLNAFYVYANDEGNLVIDGNMEDNIKAALKLVTNQEDVVDLYTKIDVAYKAAITSDEALDSLMTDFPTLITSSVGEALAQLQVQNEEGSDTESEPETEGASQDVGADTSEEQPLENQAVNQIVRATDTVNVRSSDSEEADKIGKVQPGTELTRTEERVNGWSKVIFEGREAYIKSDYLEVVSSAEDISAPIGTVMALTNVNVRSRADQNSERLGSALAGTTYDLLEEQGEWYKINYNGTVAYVKAEYFQK